MEKEMKAFVADFIDYYRSCDYSTSTCVVFASRFIRLYVLKGFGLFDFGAYVDECYPDDVDDITQLLNFGIECLTCRAISDLV